MQLSRVLGLLLCVTLSSQASQLRPWAEWKAEYSKVYDSQEADVNAFAAWLRNTEYVTAHNNQPHHTFKLKVNKFGDKVSQPGMNRGEEEQDLLVHCKGHEAIQIKSIRQKVQVYATGWHDKHFTTGYIINVFTLS